MSKSFFALPQKTLRTRKSLWKRALTGLSLTLTTAAWAAVPPSGTDNTITLSTGSATYTFGASDWGFSDTDAPANTFSGVKFTTLPTSGTLKANGTAITAGQTVSTLSTVAGSSFSAASGLSALDGLSSASSQDGSFLVFGIWVGGIRISSNGGSTWSSALSTVTPTQIAVSATGSKIFLATRQDRIYVSTDSGANWVTRDSSRFWASIACSSDGSYVSAGDGNGVYVSTDGGSTFTQRIPNSHNWPGLALSSDGSKQVACGSTEVRTSTDFGTTWTVRRNISGANYNAAASSADGTRLFVAQSAGQMLVSTDSGATWTGTGSSLNWNGVACSADGMSAVATDSSNVYVSTDGGSTWVQRQAASSFRGLSMASSGVKMLAPVGGGARTIPLYISSGTAPPTITYVAPGGGLTGSTSFTFQVQDNGATDNLDLSANTFTIQSPATLVVEGNSTSIANGDATPSSTDFTDFGSTAAIGGSVTRTFTLRNPGGVALNLTGAPAVTVSGANAADFTVTSQPTSPVPANGGTTTFQVTFDPAALGTRSATLSIANNDPSRNPFTFSIQGTGANAAPVAVGDSLARPNTIRVVKVLKSALLANDTDADGDTLSLTTVGSALPVGSTVTISGSFVVYTAPSTSSGNGSFTYTLSDGSGGHSVSGSVSITEITPATPASEPNAVRVATVPNGAVNDVVVTFVAYPGSQYRVQYAVGGAPFSWQEFSPQAVYSPADNGVITHTDPNPAEPVRVYRLIPHP